MEWMGFWILPVEEFGGAGSAGLMLWSAGEISVKHRECVQTYSFRMTACHCQRAFVFTFLSLSLLCLSHDLLVLLVSHMKRIWSKYYVSISYLKMLTLIRPASRVSSLLFLLSTCVLGACCAPTSTGKTTHAHFCGPVACHASPPRGFPWSGQLFSHGVSVTPWRNWSRGSCQSWSF